MAFPINLTKLKALLPVAVVSTSVVITIKLLSQSTPTTSQILKVNAEEDIAETNHEEEMVEPEPEAPPEPPPAEEPQEEDAVTGEEVAEAEEGEEAESQRSEDNQEESQEQKKEKDETEKPKLTLISGDIGDTLRKLLEE